MSARDTERGPAQDGPGDEGGFLSRWSRRKKAAVAGTPLPEPMPAEVSPPLAAETVVPAEEPLPDPALLNFSDDFTPFLRARVAPELKKAAMKKLFADPGFNEIDGLDVYLDDFNLIPDLPAADLATLRHARDVLWPAGEADEEGTDAVPVASLGGGELARLPDGEDAGWADDPAPREADVGNGPAAVNQESPPQDR